MAIDWREIAGKVGGFEPDGQERIVGTGGGLLKPNLLLAPGFLIGNEHHV
jgi:hypothetical protein